MIKLSNVSGIRNNLTTFLRYLQAIPLRNVKRKDTVINTGKISDYNSPTICPRCWRIQKRQEWDQYEVFTDSDTTSGSKQQ